ncbi:hypothetical protein JIQ42_03852 [Leishmania sp. Namibia]|uniref:hypothetical protein n=1 Tax=Leishmania sp. Namibia TaxID=2802991 RepID=UPI001B473186|nr:hypothetical protein JIQ42_03852 [Leishmania sp. Namibia]
MFRRAASQAVASRLFRTAVAASAAPSSVALSENRRTGLIIGNPKQGMMDPIHVSWTDIAGLDTTPGARLAAGRVLAMLDLCAARASQKAVDHQTCLTHERYLTCTVGITNTMFSSPILHGDAVRLDGRLVHCGSSSMGIYIRFYRQSPSTRTETLAGESFFTMVAITPDLKAAKVVPATELTDSLDIELHDRYVKIREIQKEIDKSRAERLKRTLTTEEVQCPINKQKLTHARINSTKVEANRIFFTSCINNNTVFGGELMAWMEQHAVHCGRMFTGNRYVFTIGMHSVAFPEPVFATDWVTLEATVIYVRNTTMEVDVVLRAERKDVSTVITNRASFVLINNDDIGQKCAIPLGLELNGATQEELQQFMEARTRYHYSVASRDAFFNNSRIVTTKL